MNTFINIPDEIVQAVSFSALPIGVANGSVGVALDTGFIYTYNANSQYWSIRSGGLPGGVYLTSGNKISFNLSNDGLLIQSFVMPPAAAGAYNGGGTGNKAIVGFDNYDHLAFSALTRLSFTARSIRDDNGNTLWGNIYWNILANFNSGALPVANDYANIIIDGLSQHLPVPLRYFKLTASHTTFNLNSSLLANERMFKMVNGTEGATNVLTSAGVASASLTGTYTSGSPIVTNLSSTASLTIGQYMADANNGEYSSSSKVPVGARIQSIDSATQITMTMNAQGTSGNMATMFYGGIPPKNRSVVSSGTTTLTGITNTDDLQVGMLVSGSLIPAHSYIISIVRNTSITLNNSVPIGTSTITFIPEGKTGIPTSNSNIGITWATILANNPNGYFVNTAPTVAGGWAAADGGWPKNSVQSAFNIVQGSSSTLDSRINSLKNVTINSDFYDFAK